MARLAALLLVFLVVFGCVVPSLDARKLMSGEKQNKFLSLKDSLVLNALPKGTVPPSAPSQKSHGVVIDEKLFAMHHAGTDRILRSVPSPGVASFGELYQNSLLALEKFCNTSKFLKQIDTLGKKLGTACTSPFPVKCTDEKLYDCRIKKKAHFKAYSRPSARSSSNKL